jgi:hypothetical protein
MTRPIERVLPLRDVVVRLRADARSVRSLFNPCELAATRDGDWTSLCLPELNGYEVLQFEVDFSDKDV